MTRLILFVLLLATPLVGYADTRMHAPCISSVARTGSMIPALHGGEMALAIPVPLSWIRIGDIIVYYNEEHHLNVIHRVEAIVHGRHRALIVKGDNNTMEDHLWVTQSRLVGLVVLIWGGDR